MEGKRIFDLETIEKIIKEIQSLNTDTNDISEYIGYHNGIYDALDVIERITQIEATKNDKFDNMLKDFENILDSLNM